jgi:hypothetical protein
MADQYVQLNPDSTGKKIDTTELIRPADAAVVERQRTVTADSNFFNNLQSVQGDGAALVRQPEVADLMPLILQELRVISQLLNEGLFPPSMRFDLDRMRAEIETVSPVQFPTLS